MVSKELTMQGAEWNWVVVASGLSRVSILQHSEEVELIKEAKAEGMNGWGIVMVCTGECRNGWWAWRNLNGSLQCNAPSVCHL
jgi:hypothetical protein